jgi:hypothetical protein
VKLLFCASARRPVARGAAARADDDNVAGPGWFSTTRRRRQAQGIAKAKTGGLYGGRVEDTGRDAGIMAMLEADPGTQYGQRRAEPLHHYAVCQERRCLDWRPFAADLGL